MFRKYLLPLLALLGAVFAVRTVVAGSTPAPIAPPVSFPAIAPFERFVAGAGIVEASGENIAIGAPSGGLVVAVEVSVGSEVAAGAPLFRLDARSRVAELAVREAALAAAQARLARLEQLPRAEELPPLVAQLDEANSALADAADEVARWESVSDPRAVAPELLARKRFAVAAAETRRATAQAQLTRAQAGSWEPDLAVARADVAVAAAERDQVAVEIERLVVRAPAAATVLQVKVRAGEYAPAGALAQPLLLLGALATRHVRVDIDENDAWRVDAKARAQAHLRGHREFESALEFVRFEPFVVPKRSLTGDANERVDTRVLQVIYRIVDPALSLFVGQQMDVFIEETRVGAAKAEAGAAR